MRTLSTISFLTTLLLSPVAIAEAPAKPRRISLRITEKGFEPNKVTVKKDEQVVLVFTRKTEKTCTKEVIVRVDDKNKLERKLPMNAAVEIPVVFRTTGELAFTCGMDMNKGLVQVQ